MPLSEFAVFGLGNPGLRYRHTRHNAGFLFLDWLAHRHPGAAAPAPRLNPLLEMRPLRLDACTVHLVKPLTFMNLSGNAYGPYCEEFGLPPALTLVVLDDVALPFGQVRLRKSGSAGGHKGLASILEHVGTRDVPRARLGVGPGETGGSLVSFVLSDFSREEMERLPEAFTRLEEAIGTILQDGFDRAMGRCNGSV